MRTILIFHEVDDVEQWLASPKRREMFGPLGITARTFVDPERSDRVGLLVQAPSMEAFHEALGTPCASEGMEFDGVRAETVQILTEL
jgi:hypothetical protein